jgi:hypothetical protein
VDLPDKERHSAVAHSLELTLCFLMRSATALPPLDPSDEFHCRDAGAKPHAARRNPFSQGGGKNHGHYQEGKIEQPSSPKTRI